MLVYVCVSFVQVRYVELGFIRPPVGLTSEFSVELWSVMLGSFLLS